MVLMNLRTGKSNATWIQIEIIYIKNGQVYKKMFVPILKLAEELFSNFSFGKTEDFHY